MQGINMLPLIFLTMVIIVISIFIPKIAVLANDLLNAGYDQANQSEVSDINSCQKTFNLLFFEVAVKNCQ